MEILKNYKGILSLIVVFFISNSSFAASADASGWSNKTMFYILLALSLLILLGIIFLSNTIKELIRSDFFKDKIYEDEKKKRDSKKDNSKIVTTMLLLVGVPFASFSQGATAPTESTDMSIDWVWAMVLLNLILVGFVFYLKTMLSNILETVKLKKEKVVVTKDGKTVPVKETNKLTQILTDTVSLEEEDSILMDHEYDGIHELDNNLPPWWLWSFYISILASFIYIFNYHVFKTGDLQIAEYDKTIIAGDEEVAKFLKEQNLNVDENSVVLLTEAKDISEGKSLFGKKCTACHGKDGGGTVGPNLTDNYWIHGGEIADVFKIVKYGNPSKGMQSWKEELNPVQIQQVASYIKSLNGTLNGGGKDPQGELSVKEITPAPVQNDSTTTVTSVE